MCQRSISEVPSSSRMSTGVANGAAVRLPVGHDGRRPRRSWGRRPSRRHAVTVRRLSERVPCHRAWKQDDPVKAVLFEAVHHVVHGSNSYVRLTL
jgi:hypothetical protein